MSFVFPSVFRGPPIGTTGDGWRPNSVKRRRGWRPVLLLVGRVGLLEVLLILGLALAPVLIALAVALWARLAGERRDQA